MTAVSEFRISVEDAALADLRDRLRRTRWPDDVPDGGWAYGTSVAYLRELTEYWIEGYDWRGQERLLNELDQYRTSIGGADLHFVHARPASPRRPPLLLLHGWPSSIWEFRRVISMLTGAGFTVVAPSLPGYGFSGRPGGRYGVDRIADIVGELMTGRLGYERFGVARGERIETPTAYLDFPAENLHPPRQVAEAMYNIRQWTTARSGGHFPALEEPDTLVDSIRRFFTNGVRP